MGLDRNLIRLRKAQGLTQDQMAGISGVHVNSIRSYEAGRAVPSADILKKIALAPAIANPRVWLKWRQHRAIRML